VLKKGISSGAGVRLRRMTRFSAALLNSSPKENIPSRTALPYGDA
jgi:hypothetical protein